MDWRSRGVYGAYRGASGVARLLPAPLTGPTARGLSRVATLAFPARRRMVARHLQRTSAVPLSEPDLRRAVARSFESYARYWMEAFRLPLLSPQEVEAQFSVEGFEHIEEGRRAGRGVILALAHLGNWDLAGRWLAQQVPVTMVVEAVQPPELFEWFAGLRRGFGVNVVALGPSAGTAVVRALRANHVVALMSDRDIEGTGIEVEFFGERTTLPGGPATLGLRTGAPVLPSGVYERGGGHQLGVIGGPLAAERTGRLRHDVARVTQLMAGELEALIRRAPEQWHVLQPNWPSDRRLC